MEIFRNTRLEVLLLERNMNRNIFYPTRTPDVKKGLFVCKIFRNTLPRVWKISLKSRVLSICKMEKSCPFINFLRVVCLNLFFDNSSTKLFPIPEVLFLRPQADRKETKSGRFRNLFPASPIIDVVTGFKCHIKIYRCIILVK